MSVKLTVNRFYSDNISRRVLTGISTHVDAYDAWQSVLADHPTLTTFAKGYATALRNLRACEGAVELELNFHGDWIAVDVLSIDD